MSPFKANTPFLSLCPLFFLFDQLKHKKIRKEGSEVKLAGLILQRLERGHRISAT
jgi:hypothetical protein